MNQDFNPDRFRPEDMPPELREFLESMGIDITKMEPGQPLAIPIPDDGSNIPEVLKQLLNHKAARELLDVGPGTADSLTDHYMPSAEQLAIKPGDRCLYASNLDSDSDEYGPVLVRVLNPEEYTDTFPDWETRVLHVLGIYYDQQEEEGALGWFSRLGLMRLDTQLQRDCAYGWMKEGSLPAIPPSWLVKKMIENLSGISKANDEFLPEPAKCIRCGSISLLLETQVTVTKKHLVGHMPKVDLESPESHYYVYSTYGNEENKSGIARCLDCGFLDDLMERDVDIYLSPK